MSITQEVDLTIPAKDRLPEHGVWAQLNAMELSLEERTWLLDHLEESPAVALKGWDKSIPHNPAEDHHNYSVNPWCEEHPGIVPKGMENILARIRDVKDASPSTFGFYERSPRMIPLIGVEGEEKVFHGYDAIRQCILDSLEYERRFREIAKKDPSAALHPSMYTRDPRGRLSYQGPGSDRGIVRQFVCWISHEEIGEVAPEWAAAAASDEIVEVGTEEAEKVSGLGADFRLIEGDNYFECPVEGCNYRKSYNQEDEQDRRTARAAMRTHMVRIKTNIDDHREAKVVIFG